MTTPLVPPTPPSTADAADFEYPLGMPYTLTQWRQAHDMAMLKGLAIISLIIHLPVAALLISIPFLSNSFTPAELAFAAVGVLLALRGIAMVLLPHPTHVAIDGVCISLFGISTLVMPPWFILYTRIAFGMPLPQINGPNLLAIIILGIMGWNFITMGRQLLHTARRLSYLAQVRIPPDLARYLLRMRDILVSPNRLMREDVVCLRVGGKMDDRWLYLRDGYAFVMPDYYAPLLLRRGDIRVTITADTVEQSVQLCLDQENVNGKMSREHLDRLRAWLEAVP